MRKLKYFLYDIFYTDKTKKGWIYYIDDYFITTLIVLNVLAIILQSFRSIDKSLGDFFLYFEIFSVVVFTLEYLIRFWVADIHYNYRRMTKIPSWKCRLKYVFSFMGMIDLLAILPFYLPFIITLDLRFLRILRLLRLFRLFKLAHYSRSLRIVGQVMSEKKSELLITVFATIIVLLITSSLMYEIEHEVQPENFENILSTLWWAVATLTTIGYGDVYPLTDWGRFLAGLTALFGIGLVAIPTGIISAGFLEALEKKNKVDNPRLRKLRRSRRY